MTSVPGPECGVAGAGRLAAVTGGTGFLGRVCVAALARAGWRVRLLVRRDPAHPLLAGVPMETVRGDLACGAALARLVEGASVVVHAAGAIKARSAAAFQATNRDGTGRLAEAAARVPGCRFVHISSQVARAPELSPYAASKRDGERALAAALGGAAQWVILRPCVVYGPWDAATLSLLRVAAGPLVPAPRAPSLRLAMVHVCDVAGAVLAFCGASLPAGRVFEVCDAVPDGHDWRDIVRLAAPAPPRLVGVPDRLLLAAGALADCWSAVTGQPGLFGRGKAREILHRDWRPDPGLRVPAAIWQPRIDLARGLRDVGRGQGR